MSSRLRAVLVVVTSAIFLALGAFLLVVSFYMLFILTFSDSERSGAPAYLFFFLSLALLVAACVIFMRRTAFRDAKLTISGNRVVISDPRGLSAPISVGIEHIRALEVFDPYLLAEHPEVAQLYLGTDGAPQVPLLPMGGLRGNLVVLFKVPVELIRLRRVRGSKGRRVPTRYAVSGLILKASRPARAREQLATIGVRTTIEDGDLDVSFKAYELAPGLSGS